ncbi:hypothetical protein ACFPTY_11345 [Halomonas beimenensis]|uniref:Uncharacterized protein n=1 Tax=Halomonas beimenensis TaxID=475662 RepID=A0A291P9R4_9GAMM|nr:hypothetical protein [Halomonas beimenensis]ATJ83608.1 hypothetical protein BEI_2621 [Halomonas beimenensis]
MILKEKTACADTDERGFPGPKQEQDLALPLRRESGDSERIRFIMAWCVFREDEPSMIQERRLTTHGGHAGKGRKRARPYHAYGPMIKGSHAECSWFFRIPQGGAWMMR